MKYVHLKNTMNRDVLSFSLNAALCFDRSCLNGVSFSFLLNKTELVLTQAGAGAGALDDGVFAGVIED